MNYIVTKNPDFFKKIGNYNFCELKDMVLPNKIALDKETTGLKALKDKVFSIQIGTGKDNYLIDLQEYDTPLIKGKQLYYEEVISYIKDKELVGHNISFDIGFAYMKGFFPDKIRDTMIASKILHNGEMELNEAYKLVPMRHGFGQVMERELGVYYDKSEQKNIHKVRLSTAKAIQYCFNDVDRLLELEDNLYQKLVNYGATETYKLNCDYLKAMVYMELCGLPISTQKWAAKSEVDKQTSLELQGKIIEYIFDKYPQFRHSQLNMFESVKKIYPLLSSSDQMIPVFEAMGINVIDDEGKKSISEDVINKSPHEFVELWLEYKGYEHRVTTFGNNILSKVENGHIYTNFNPIVDTCRISSRKGEINFLNFPSDKITRDCFVASTGYKIIVADFSNQEAVTLADKSGNTASLKTILEGADSHCILAREVYPELKDLSDDEIKKKHKDKRQIGKIANFTFAFGGTGYTAAKNLNISLSEGDRIYEAYRRINKETFDWGETIYREAIKTGYIESADGFKLKLPYYDDFIKLQKRIKSLTQDEWSLYKVGKQIFNSEVDTKNLSQDENKALQFYINNKESISNLAKTKSKYMRLCLNNPIQATAAHETKRSMVNLFKYIKFRGHLRQCRIANCVHDEIILECKEELVEEYKEALGRIMRESANYYLKSGLVEMEADANVGDSWYEAK